MKKFVLFLTALALLLSACGAPAASRDAALNDGSPSTGAPGPPPSSAPLRFFGVPGFGIGNGAPAENGFYYIQQRKTSCANLMYLDYATNTAIPLCSRPECRHEDETCTSYLGWRGGYPWLLVNGKDLILLYANAGGVYPGMSPEAALPSIQMQGLNGEGRKTVATLAANEDIMSQAACDGQNVYFIKTATGETDTKTAFCAASLETGEVKELYVLPRGTSFLAGAAGRQAVIKCFSQPEDGSLYSDDDTQTFFCIDVDSGVCVRQKELPFLRTASALQALVDGVTLYQYAPDENVLTVEDLPTGTVLAQVDGLLEQKPLGGQLVAVFDGRLLLEEVDGAGAATLLWCDLTSGEQGVCGLKGNYAADVGKTFSIVPSCAVGGGFLVVYGFDAAAELVEGVDGEPVEAQLERQRFGLISREDYFSNRPNFAAAAG